MPRLSDEEAKALLEAQRRAGGSDFPFLIVGLMLALFIGAAGLLYFAFNSESGFKLNFKIISNEPQTPEDVYQICKKQTSKIKVRSTSPVGRQIETGIIGGMCEKIKQDCLMNFNGGKCQEFKEAYKKRKRGN